jgi:hypothetical protein
MKITRTNAQIEVDVVDLGPVIVKSNNTRTDDSESYINLDLTDVELVEGHLVLSRVEALKLALAIERVDSFLRRERENR